MQGMRLRALAGLGRMSMYRLTACALVTLTAVAFVLSAAGLAGPRLGPLALSLVVLAAAGTVSDLITHRIIRARWRPESTLITTLILFFVMLPGTSTERMIGLVLAAAAASASKVLIAWRGRHIVNPAALGALVATLSGLAPAGWWVATPALALPVLLAGLIVLTRVDKLRVAGVFVAVAVSVTLLRVLVQLEASGNQMTIEALIVLATMQTPVLFLAAFMLSEPLTLPPRRWQQIVVAVVAGTLVGWPVATHTFSLGPDGALVAANVIGFVLAVRTGIPLRLKRLTRITPTVTEATFATIRPVRFVPGQYVELDVPHPRPDARGTRREFSIVSAGRGELTVAYRDADDARSSFKRALASLGVGGTARATGVWGDFILPRRRDTPVVLVGAGIGVTPFVSLIESMSERERSRTVLVLVASQASELVYADAFAGQRVDAIIFTPDAPSDVPTHWRWMGGARVDAATLAEAVPDLADRVAFVSGPPRLIAALRPALHAARAVRTDAFAGA